MVFTVILSEAKDLLFKILRSAQDDSRYYLA